jgi:hypothetical protein
MKVPRHKKWGWVGKTGRQDPACTAPMSVVPLTPEEDRPVVNSPEGRLLRQTEKGAAAKMSFKVV